MVKKSIRINDQARSARHLAQLVIGENEHRDLAFAIVGTYAGYELKLV
jgi:hypothetical protein